MFFQINITPKEKKTSRKIAENAQEESKQQEEEYTLILAPFQPQTRVKLDTTIYNAVQCRLNVQNPSNKNIHVTVSKIPSKERCIELTAMELLVEPESSVDLGIIWTPQECGSWRDTLQLTDSRRVKYDVALMTTAISDKKVGTKGRSRVLVPSNSNKTVTRKPCKISSPMREPKKTAYTAALGPSNVPNKRPRLNFQPENKENFTKPGWTYETSNNKQKNPMSSPPIHDFSSIFNSTGFNLTPLHSNVRKVEENPETRMTKSSPIKFSPQRPLIIFPEIKNPPVLRRETYNAGEYLRVLTTHDEEEKEDELFADSLSPQPEEAPECAKQPNRNFEAPASDFSILINDMNLLTPKSSKKSQASILSPNGWSTGNITKPITGNLSPNGLPCPIYPANDTFNVSGPNVANNLQANSTYELLTSPTRSTDSIKPKTLSKNFDTMSPVHAQESAPPTSTPLCFERISLQPEFESRRTNVCYTPRLNMYEDTSVKEVLEADLWVKPDLVHQTFSVSSLKGRCSSLEKISEEPRFNNALNRTKKSLNTKEEKTSTKTRCIEISPPKKFSSCGKNATIRRISPTKGTKIRKEKSGLEPAASLRKKVQMNCSIKHGRVSIPGVRIANLSLAGLRKTSKEKNTSLQNESREVSVKLHDPNDFIIRFCNPDPFSPTMTHDPFLTSTLYYDEKWVFHQEMTFKKWLNALLTPPEHLNADVDTIRVDVGKVWQSCRSRENVALAETREAVSARYHTNTRLNTLRKAACAMFRRDEVATALSRVTVCVERGTLTIRQDRDLHRDIGLQKEILELFFSYNPLWLRIGLETIYGETIPLHSNNDLVGLTKFLIARFFSDPFIVKTHSHANVTSLKMPTFNFHINKFILKKFLLIVFFLDYAKRNKLIGHDPCLFHKKATHKESRAILLTFSREVLSGVGDVTKVLKSYGYVVSHKQTYLDEYDYAVKDLAIDLRDGVRLCRIMELITGDRNLTCCCRVPAISRLQKVHNAEVALSALLRCGYTLTGDIDARSVADGHREKTLSLLWQIIYKYQAPRFEKAAKTVQKFWRAKLWYVRVRHFLRTRKYEAAAKIQRAWRCYKARKELQKLREEKTRLWAEREKAVRVIQRHWSERIIMLKERRKFLLTIESILKIQRWYRTRKATAPYVQKLRSKRQAVITIQQRWRSLILARRQRNRYLELVNASRKIQKLWRARQVGRKVYRTFQTTRRAIVIVQSKWRAILAMRKDREVFQRKINSARKIQTWWRRILLLKHDRNSYLLKKHAVVTIESWLIGRKIVEIEKSKFNITRNSIITLQRTWRRYYQTKESIACFKLKIKACKIIQQWWKSAKIAKNYNLQRRSCIIIQRWWRGCLLTKSAVVSFANTKNAAIVVQKNWRMKTTRRDYIHKRKTIMKIQSWYRNVRICRAICHDYKETKRASIVLQIWWKSWKVAREQRHEYLQLKSTVINVQTRWRANNLAKKMRNDYLAKKRAAIKIQAHRRMIKERRNYNELLKRHKAVTFLQNRWRETLKAKKLRKAYIEKRSAIIAIQTRFRALTIARQTRLNYLKIRSATIVIQKNWRMLRALKTYRKLNEAAVVLQSRFRARKCCIENRASFLALKNAAVNLQRRYRAKKISLQTRQRYLQLRTAAQNIQIRWRANLKMRDEKNRFSNLRKAAIVLQANSKMILERRRYRITRKAVLTIQTKWRAITEARKVRATYDALRASVLIVQRRFRANKACKIAREDYSRVREKVIWIQKAWRKKLENRMREEAAIGIQTWWISILAMRKSRQRYKCQKAAVLVLQRRFRAYKIGKETRQEYVRIVRSIVTIQRCWRIYIEQKKYDEWLRDCKKATLLIEDWWLIILELKQIKAEKIALLKRRTAAALKIQRTWRGYKVREKMSSILRQLKERSEKAAKAAVPTATIAFQMKESMNMLLHCEMVGQYAMYFTKIDTFTRMLPSCSIAFCESNLVDKIYTTMSKSNRSLPWMDVIVKCTSILITLAKLPETKKYVYRVEYIETLVRFMTITVERHPNLFLHFATLLWLLAENPDYAEAIRSCPRTTWLLDSLYNTITKKKSGLSVGNLNKSRSVAKLPNSKPDWGLMKQKRPRLFTTVHHAITTLMKRLKMHTAE